MRLTVYPDGPGDGFEVRRAREMGRGSVSSRPKDLGAPAGFSATRPGWDDQVRSSRDIKR